MPHFDDLLSSFDSDSALRAMRGEASPPKWRALGVTPKDESPSVPAKSTQQQRYSNMSDETANGLTEETRVVLNYLESEMRSTRENLNRKEEAAFSGLAGGRLSRNEFEKEMNGVNQGRNAPVTGLAAQQDLLRMVEGAASRVITAVQDVSQRMGVTAPSVSMFSTLTHKGPAFAGRSSSGEPGIVISPSTVDALSDSQLRFVAGHEISHEADPQANRNTNPSPHSREFFADSSAIKATCDVEAGISALNTLARQQAQHEESASHPSLEARFRNMQEVYDRNCISPAVTPSVDGSSVRKSR